MNFNIWIFMYSFTISLLLTGIGHYFLYSDWKSLFVSPNEMMLFGWIFSILLNLIVYMICYVSINSCTLKDVFAK